ncbi:phage tail tape measure protein [Salmonella enterica subsp. diarizonae]|uniref:phage tail tape measure protein n=1 Tax=Salmonella enterica TaxID=28901 RepID=UPI0009B0FBF7|nr:phage tail tape measure protein [Salmonella enterica]EAW1825158.1 phage tail tape measure protein [Salmonella enterica subsp. diarizonae]EDT6983940.1 phage tail tape measure protein [Salmonella enterica subsp. arizonae]EAR0004199.1 phage tail tape measure protein [Salmonella enterica]EAT2563529.1 phage tail tape measure protein [Salmonella enterica]EAW0465329.1 phage tail tape measure protein [Salmonella enterica]
MADEIASLVIKVESGGINKATDALNNLAKSGQLAEDAAGSLSDAWGGLGKSAQTATGYQDRYVQSVNRYLRQEKEAQKQTRLTSEEWNKQNDALQELLGQINPLIGAFGRLDEAEKKLQGFHKSGLLDADDFKDYTAQINKMRVDLEAAAHARTEQGQAEARAAREAAAVEKAATVAKQSFIDKLKTESETLGLTTHQMLEYKAAQLGVTKEAQPYIAKLKAAEAATGSLGLKSAMARRELGVLIGELARGNFGQLRGSGITLANRAGWIDKLFTLRGLGIAGVIGGIGAAVYALGKAWYEGSQEAVEFNKQLILTGGYAGKTAGQLQDMARALAGNGVTQHDAAGVLAQVVGSGAFSGSDVNMVARTAARMKEVVGQSVDETIRQFKRLQDDPVNAAKELDKTLHFLTATQLEQIRVLGEQGRTADAAKIAMSAYSEEMNNRMSDVHDNLGWVESAWNAVGDAAKWAWDRMLDIGREDTLDEKIAKLQKKIKDGGQQIGKAFIPVTQQDRDNLAALQEKDFQEKLKAAQDQGERDYQETQKRRNKENTALDHDNETEEMRHKNKIAWIKSQEYADASKRNAALERENERHKKAMDRQTKKPPAYHDDEATRLLTQYREKQSKLQGELDNSRLYSNQKLTESEKELLALETRIAGMKGKALTAADKSILARQKELEAILGINAGIEKQLRNQEALNKLQEKGVQLAQQHRQQLEQLRVKGEFDVASMGMGSKERQRALEEFNLKQQFANEMKEIDRVTQRDGTYGSQEYFALAAENAASLNEQLVQMKQNYENIDAAQGNWVNGFSAAYQDFMAQGADVAGMTKQVFSNAFNGMTDALTQFALTGKMNFKSFAVSVLADLAKMEARIATSKALGMLINWGMAAIGGAAAGGSTPSGAYESAAAGLQFAKGGAVSSPDLSMYSGQILTQPTFFKFARGGGVAGEAGPEAILPLARDSRGYMGVRLADKGGKQQLPPIQITVTQHIDQRGTDQNDQAAAQRNNQQLARMMSDMVETKVHQVIDGELRDGGKLAGVR